MACALVMAPRAVLHGAVGGKELFEIHGIVAVVASAELTGHREHPLFGQGGSGLIHTQGAHQAGHACFAAPAAKAPA